MKKILWSLLFCLLGSTVVSQSRTGPVVRIPHHQRILDFFQGGDGHYYLFMSSSGSSGRFSVQGESNFSLRRFSPDLVLEQELRFRRTDRQAGWPENVYAAFATQRGLALLSVQSTAFAKAPELFLYQLEFQDTTPVFHAQRLALLSDHVPGLTNPNIRVFEHRVPRGRSSPHGPAYTILWRQINEFYDNSMGTIFLEDHREDTLRVQSRVELPFKKLLVPIQISEIQPMAHPSLLYRIEGHDPGILNPSRSSTGAGFLWQFPRDTAAFFRFSNQRMIPLSVAGDLVEGSDVTTVSGFFAGATEDSLEIGRYQGNFRSDTIDFDYLAPVDAAISDFILQRYRERNQLISYRRVLQNWLIRDSYVAHFIGVPQIPEIPKSNRKVVGHTLYQSRFFQPPLTSHAYLFQSRFEEYQEVNGIIRIGDTGLFLANQVPEKPSNRELKSPELRCYSSDDLSQQASVPHTLFRQKQLTIPCPRWHARSARKDEYVFVARYRKNLRLVAFSLPEDFIARK